MRRSLHISPPSGMAAIRLGLGLCFGCKFLRCLKLNADTELIGSNSLASIIRSAAKANSCRFGNSWAARIARACEESCAKKNARRRVSALLLRDSR